MFILGAGCLCAAGPDLRTCVDSILKGERHWVPGAPFPTGHRAEAPIFPCPGVAAFDPEVFRTTALLEQASDQALADAGLSARRLSRLRVGVCLGTITPTLLANEIYYRPEQRAELTPEALYRRHREGNPARRVRRRHGLSGPCVTLSNACTSGADAIALAALWLRTGVCELALAGGGDEVCHTLYAGFASLGVLSGEPCRPFDAHRSGLNLGEGAAVVVLGTERLIRNANPRGRLLGVGLGSDAYHLAAPHPEGRGLRTAMNRALEDWGGQPRELAFVNAHGTATRDNDLVEGRVLAQVLPETAFFSTKGNTGHTLGGAGAIEFALSLGLLERGVAPASAGFQMPDPAIAATPTTRTQAANGTVALSLSLGFGGQNTALVLGV